MQVSKCKKCKKVIAEQKESIVTVGDELNEEIGACGVYCGFCSVFRLEQNRCFGCEWLGRQLRKTRENHKGCVFWECTRKSNVECCFQCEQFPCKMHYDQEYAVYTKQALDSWKELERTGFTF